MHDKEDNSYIDPHEWVTTVKKVEVEAAAVKKAEVNAAAAAAFRSRPKKTSLSGSMVRTRPERSFAADDGVANASEVETTVNQAIPLY